MFGLDFKFENNMQAVRKAADRAVVRNLKITAFAIRKTSIESIQAAPPGQASQPGTPVNTRARGVIKSGKNKGKKRLGQVQRAITYDVDANAMNAVIGPRASVVGESMKAHEFGEEFKGERFSQRPTMGPALDKNTSLFANSFQGSIGQ